MPKYIVEGRTYNIPDDKVEGFERKYPNSSVEYYNGEQRYHIPISKREGFLKKFPNAVTQVQQQEAEQPKPSLEVEQANVAMEQPVSVAPTIAVPTPKATDEVSEDNTAVNQPISKVETPATPKFGTQFKSGMPQVGSNAATEKLAQIEKSKQVASVPKINTELPTMEGVFEQQKNAEPEYAEGIGQGLVQGTKALGANLTNFAGETVNLVTGSSRDDAGALAKMEQLEAISKQPVLSKAERKMHERYADDGGNNKIAMIQDENGNLRRITDEERQQHKDILLQDDYNKIINEVLDEAEGDANKAYEILSQRANNKTLGDKWIENASEIAATIKPTKGFGAWVGNLIPQMIAPAIGMGVGLATKNAKAAKAIGGITMGTMSAATAGQSMKEARDAGATSGQVWLTGITDGLIEWATEHIPYERYTKRIINSTKQKIGDTLTKALNSENSPLKGELADLLTKADKKLNGKLLNGNNVTEYIADIATEGASEFTAEALQAITPIIYANEEDYPTFKGVLNAGWEGFKAGMFMGSVLGGVSNSLEYAQNRNRRKQQGYVDVAQVKINDNGETAVGEVLSKNIENGTIPMLIDGVVEEVNPNNIIEQRTYSFNEVEEANVQKQQDESFEQGYDLVEPQQMNDAQLELEEAENDAIRAFGVNNIEDVDAALNDMPLSSVLSMVDGEEAQQQILNYLNAKARVEGMYQKVRDDIDSAVEESNKLIDSRVNEETHMIQPATLKTEDRQVYVVSGNVKMFDDGSAIDPANSSEHIIVKDAATGKLEMLSPNDVLRADVAIDPVQEKAMATEAIRDEKATIAANNIDGVVPFNAGDEYVVMFDDGTQHTAKVLADNGDGNVQVQIDNEPQATVASKEQVQQMVNAANKARVAQNKQAQIEQEQVVEEQAQQEAEKPKYAEKDTITIRLDDGREVRGSISKEADADGNIEVFTEQPIDGDAKVAYFTEEELDGRVVMHNDQAIELPTPEPVTALSQIPMDENSEPLFEQAPASLTYDALVEMNEGDAAEALDTAQQMLAIAKKELKAEEKSTPKVGGNVMEIQKAKAEKKERLKPLQERVAYWESVVNEPTQRKAKKAETASLAEKVEAPKAEEVAEVAPQEVIEEVKPVVEMTPEESAKIMQKVEKRKGMAKAQSALKEKGRYAKEDAELGDYLDFNDYVMRAIATGSVRFKWSNKPDSATRGLGAHLGASASNEERQSRIWMLSNDFGLYPEEAAEQLLTSYAEYLGYEPNIDTMGALSEIIDIVQSYPKSKMMMEAAQARHAKDSQQAENDYYENEYVKQAAEENGMTVDEWMAFIDEYVAQYDDIKAIFAEAYLEYEQLNQNNNEQGTGLQGVQQAVSAAEQNTTNDNRGSEVLPTEQSDTNGGVQQGETERRSDEEAVVQGDSSVSISEAQEAILEKYARRLKEAAKELIAEETLKKAIGRSLTSKEAKSVIATMQQNAEQVELMELTPENWVKQFGESGILATPIGDVKMGENQYFKLAQKGRDGKLGMIKPTLQTPDVIVEEKSSAKAGQKAERESSYVFVKAFTNDDGSRNYLFTSVTIRKEGREVVISNQEKETPRIERLLKEGKLAYISKATLPSESTNSTQGNQSTILGGAILSESKDNTSQNKKQEIEQKNATESDNYRFKSVYHGSGADFDKFDHSFMGTGEGHQAFGWGTYVTDVEGIGKQYARMTSKPQLTFKGEFVNAEGFYNPWRIVSDLYQDNQGKLREMRAKAERYSSLVEEDNPKLKALWEDVKQVLATVRSGDLDMKPARHLYSVEIPDDNGSNYIYRDKNVPTKTFDKLVNLLPVEDVTFWTPEHIKNSSLEGKIRYWMQENNSNEPKSWGNFYEALSVVLGSDKAASEFLNSIGYVGIIYPADNGKAKGANNYVIFNEADLDVTDNIRFRSAEAAPTFYSNAEYAVKAVKQEKATPEQWLKMIEKNGGLKAGEDKWLGLSDWLKDSDKKTLTKQEVLDFIKENQIQIEEVEYVEKPQGFEELKREYDNWLRDEGFDYAWEQLTDRYGDDATIAFEDLGGELEISDSEAASALLGGENAINSTRLDYTTDGLDNKREIALVVPNIESWNANDNIHFGDAGDGRAVAWVRFGETIVPVTKVKEVKAFNEPRKSEMTGRDVYTPIGTKNSKDYVIYGKMRTGEMAYVVFIGENPVSKHNTLEEARLAMNEYYKEHKHYIPAGQERVLVIDEVQSKRHQEGREKGYVDNKPTLEEVRAAKANANGAFDKVLNFEAEMKDKYDAPDGFWTGKSSEEDYATYTNLLYEWKTLSAEYNSLQELRSSIPSAPFEKNWAELAMKRMLRYAAENGFDKVAWTTGEQQAERYDLSKSIDRIVAEDNTIEEASDGTPMAKDITLTTAGGMDIRLSVDANGVVRGREYDGKKLSDVVGKPLADKLMQKGYMDISGDGLKVGGEGMKALYDQMLPSFMNKYGKKWGVKVGEVTMPSLEENNTMHSIDVTDAMRESVMQGQPMFRKAADFKAQFKELQSEYYALDKNDEGALNEWRNKKRDVVDGYLNHIKNRFGMRSELVVFNGADEAQMQDAYNKLVEAYAAKGYTNPPTYESFKEHSSKPSVAATYRNGGDIITFNVSSKDTRNDKIKFASTLFHENAHRIAYTLYNKQEMAQIWDEAKETNHHIAKAVESTYGQKSDAGKGNEFIGKSIGYLVAEYNPLFLDFVKGKNGVSAQDLTKKLKYKNRTGKFVVEEILNVIKDEYQEQFAQRDESGSLGGVRDGRGSRDVGGVSSSNEGAERRGRTVSERHRARVLAATTLAEQLGTEVTIIENLDEIADADKPTLRAKRGAKGWYDLRTGEVVIVIPNATSVEDVQRTVLHEVVAHKGLRDVIGRERFKQFLEKVFYNADADTRRKIAQLAAKNGWNTRVATEEYMADIAEEGFDARENRSFWEKVRDLFMDMLREAKIALGYNINDNDLRYMLWRTYQMQKNKGVMGAAEDILMQQKLGVGNYRTRPVGEEKVSFRSVYHGSGADFDKFDHSFMGTGEGNRAFGWGTYVTETKGKAEKYAKIHPEAMDKALRRSKLRRRQIQLTEAIPSMKGEALKEAESELKAIEKELAGLINFGFRHLYTVEIPDDNGGNYLYWDKNVSKETIEDLQNKLGLPNTYFISPYPFTGERIYKVLSELLGGDKAASEFLNKNGYVGISYPAYDIEADDARNYVIFSDADLKITDNVRFRSTGKAQPAEAGVKNIRTEYDKKVNTGKKGTLKMTKYNFIEAMQDEMRSLKEYQNLIKKSYGLDKIPPYLDVYMRENRIGSAGFEEFKAFENGVYAEMNTVIDNLIKSGTPFETIKDYAIAKSGLERNREFSVRDYIKEKASEKLITEAEAQARLDAVNKDLQDGVITPTEADAQRQQIQNLRNENKLSKDDVKALRETYKKARDSYRGLLQQGVISYQQFNKVSDEFAKKFTGKPIEDYSGLSAMAEKKGKDAKEWSNVAAEVVAQFERKHDSAKLWEAINACNDAVLKRVFDSGMLNSELYDYLRQQFLWYIPMSGFTEDTAEDVYSYIGNETGAFTPSVKGAAGRLSESDDPFAIIGNKMQGAILQGNRNMLKQTLLNLSRAYPTDLITEGKVWLEKKQDGTWETNMLDIPEDTPSDKVAEMVEERNKKMKALKKQGLAEERKNKLDVPYKIVTKSHRNDHEIVAYRNGEPIVMYVNGNPQLAKAINGKLKNRETNILYSAMDKVNRLMSANKTSYNPDFIPVNVNRDVQQAVQMAFLDAGVKDAAEMAKTWFAVFPEVVRKVSGSKREGKFTKFFDEFVRNGGETGYSHLNDVEAWKRLNRKRWARLSTIEKIPAAASNIFGGLADMFGYLNRIAEDSTRFAAYVHSRQKGNTIAESIKAAKDITTNFNKKGSAGTEGLWGELANFLRRWMLFFNPMVQGVYQQWEKMKAHPKRYALAVSYWMALGFLVAALNDAASGDDDEEKKYFNQTDYTRRNNLLIFTGDGYVKIPLPPIFREIYGIGDILYGAIKGKATAWESTAEVFNLLRSIFNLEGQSSLKDQDFSVLRFVLPQSVEFIADISDNTTFTGMPLYKKTEWNKNEPEYKKVYNGTWEGLINLSKAINDILPHDEHLSVVNDQEAGKGSGLWLNPAVAQHIIEEVTGGTGKFVGDIITIASNLKDGEETNMYNIPIAKRYYNKPDERTRSRLVKSEYFELTAELERLHDKFSKYQKYLDQNVSKEEKAELEAEYWDSKVGKRHKLIKNAKSRIDKYNQMAKKEDGENEKLIQNLNAEAAMRILLLKLKELELE